MVLDTYRTPKAMGRGRRWAVMVKKTSLRSIPIIDWRQKTKIRSMVIGRKNLSHGSIDTIGQKSFWTVGLIDGSILSFACVPTDRWHRSEKAFVIDCRYHRSKIKKSSTDGSITSIKWDQKHGSIVSIDTIGIDTSPIVPSYSRGYWIPTHLKPSREVRPYNMWGRDVSFTSN
jgi:hypothetical protein